MLRFTDGVNTLQGITVVLGSTLTLSESASGQPQIDVTPAAPGSGFFSALRILANTVGGHRQLWLVDHATETKYNWMFGTQPGSDNVELTPSTVVGGTTFSTPIITWNRTGEVGIGATSLVARLTVRQVSPTSLLDLVGTGAQIRHYDDSGVQRLIETLDTSTSQYRFAGAALIVSLDYSNSRVGIGIAAPTERLVVSQNQNATTRLLVTNTDTTNSSSRAGVRVVSGTITGDLVAIIGNGVWMGSATSDTVHIMTNGVERITVDTSGNTSVLGSGSSAGKLTSNRFILPAGVDLWAV